MKRVTSDWWVDTAPINVNVSPSTTLILRKSGQYQSRDQIYHEQHHQHQSYPHQVHYHPAWDSFYRQVWAIGKLWIFRVLKLNSTIRTYRRSVLLKEKIFIHSHSHVWILRFIMSTCMEFHIIWHIHLTSSGLTTTGQHVNTSSLQHHPFNTDIVNPRSPPPARHRQHQPTSVTLPLVVYT